MKLYSLAVFALSLVYAEISINNPIDSTQWTAGSKVDITWISSDSSPLDGNIKIELRNGDPKNMAYLGELAKDVPANSMKASVQLPKDLVTGSDYAVSISDSANKQVYSHTFSIKGGDKPAPRQSEASISVSTSTSASGSSGSTSAPTNQSSSPSATTSGSSSASGTDSASSSATDTSSTTTASSSVSKRFGVTSASAIAVIALLVSISTIF